MNECFTVQAERYLWNKHIKSENESSGNQEHVSRPLEREA